MVSQDDSMLLKMIEKIKSKEVDFVRVEAADINGCSRGFLLDADWYLNNYKNGFSVSRAFLSFSNRGDLISDTGYLEEIGYKDSFLYPDIETFKLLPWTDKTASVLADARLESYNAESPCIPSASRSICKIQLDKLNALGIRFYSAFEFEFYLLNEKTKRTVESNGNYVSTQTGLRYAELMQDIMRNMKQIGIMPRRYSPECGPSQQELTYEPAFGIGGADNAFTYKQLVKELALKNGCMATFMTMPFPSLPGSSGHFNFSLWDQDGNNLLYDQHQKHGLSSIAQHWLAGIIHHTDSLLCLSSSTPNCYERTRVGAFAPTTNAWGIDNRSVAYRVKNSGTNRVYFENRLSPAAVNPYLLTAGCIIAGMDGIKHKMELKADPFEGEIKLVTKLPEHVKALPKSLSESLDCLLNNKVFVEELGGEFLKCFAAFKKKEDELAQEKRNEDELYQWYMDYYGTYI